MKLQLKYMFPDLAILNRPTRFRSHQGFSLVELLSSIALLAFLLAVLFQILGMVEKIWTTDQQRIDNFTKARATLDLIARDVQFGIFRPDVAAFCSGGEAPYQFYSQRYSKESSETSRQLALIGYRLSPYRPCSLERAARLVDWKENQIFGETNRFVLPLREGDFQEVSDGVVRMVFFFIQKDGTYSLEYNHDSRATGIVLAVIDSKTETLLKDLKKIDNLKREFDLQQIKKENLSQLNIKQLWEKKLADPNFLKNYPQPLANGLRIFERSVSLPSTQKSDLLTDI